MSVKLYGISWNLDLLIIVTFKSDNKFGSVPPWIAINLYLANCRAWELKAFFFFFSPSLCVWSFHKWEWGGWLAGWVMPRCFDFCFFRHSGQDAEITRARRPLSKRIHSISGEILQLLTHFAEWDYKKPNLCKENFVKQYCQALFYTLDKWIDTFTLTKYYKEYL